MMFLRFLRRGLRVALPTLLLHSAATRAQTPADTTRAVALPAATVTGYGQRLPLRRTAAAVGVLDARTIRVANF